MLKTETHPFGPSDAFYMVYPQNLTKTTEHKFSQTLKTWSLTFRVPAGKERFKKLEAAFRWIFVKRVTDDTYML